MNKISAVYKITNKVTGECYVGSSRNVYKRWTAHKCPSTWKNCPNNRMYQDMQKYGVDQFEFEIIVPAAPTHLRICEQEFIDIYKPIYNSNRANTGLDYNDEVERKKLYYQKYRNERLEHQRQYNTEHKVERREYMTKYENKSAVYWFKDENGNVVYVGSTNNLYKRMYNHNWCIKNSDRPNSKLYQFLRTNNYIVDYYYTEDYKLREREMIEEYKPMFNRVRVVATSKLDISVKAADNYNEYHRQYLQANKEYNAEHREYCRQWAKEHRSYFKKWYKEHKQS